MFCNNCGAPNPDVASFCNKCGKAIARPAAVAVAAAPSGAQPASYVMDVTPAVASSAIAPAPIAAPRAAGSSPAPRETPSAVSGALSAAARVQFSDGLIVEINQQIEDKCFPGAIAAWILTLVVVARYSITALGTRTGLLIAVAIAFVIAGIAFKIVRGVLEDKYLRPIAVLSDEMLVNRYNEAKADRRAAHTRTVISWAVIAIIVVVLMIAWVAAQRH